MVINDEGPIQDCSWGRYEIMGVEHSKDGMGAGKDIFIHGKTVNPWYERKGHRLDIRMVESAIKTKPEILIIGNGYRGKLKVPAKVISEINRTVGEVIVLPTPEACSLYNRFYQEGKKVVLLVHGTC